MSEINFSEEEYQKLLKWLFVQTPNYQVNGVKAYKAGLENIKKLCDFFGNPQNSIKTVHIGGTNGKGSTSSMLASVLQEEGYSVGLYSSPHLVDFTERIKVNGVLCDKEFVYGFIQKLQKIPKNIRPSFFEYTTVMAFEYFSQKKVDIAIIEVGLGGRLDSTNIIRPLVSAITNVSLDHQDILGSTIEQIAGEKAGIIKKEIPVVSGDENETIKNIISEKAENNKARFIDATLSQVYFSSDLKGKYQQKNIRTVLSLIEELKKQNYSISKESVEKGLLNVQRNTGFIGRWYWLSEKPLIICDTAHNYAGLREVFAQLQEYTEPKHIVMGFVEGKNIDKILALMPKDSYYYFVKPFISRGRNPKDYENLLKKEQLRYKIFNRANEGYSAAKTHCGDNEMIFVGGSNFVVGEILEENLQEDKEFVYLQN